MRVGDRFLDRFWDGRWGTAPAWWRYLYIINAYFMFSLDRRETSHHYMIRTPLVSVCHYWNSPLQAHDHLFTGWMLHWWPNWRVFRDRGATLYCYECDWTRITGALQ